MYSMNVVPLSVIGQSVTTNAVPLTGIGQPVATNAVPLTRIGQSVRTNVVPLTRIGQPVATNVVPLTQIGQPVTTSVVPLTQIGQPVATNVVPLTRIGQPVTTAVRIGNKNDWMRMESSVEVIEVPSNCCNEMELMVLDMRQFVSLRELKVGDECFAYVKEVRLMGLHQLERVLIGNKSFRRDMDRNSNGKWYLKNCERLRELKMGYRCFEDYSVCEIENVPSLEVIEMGELIEDSYNFYYASLELKIESQRKE